MARVRLSTTVDGTLLVEARKLAGSSDSALVEAALTAFLAAHRSAQIDDAYAAGYAEHPVDEPDEWGDLESFRRAAGAS